jgi:hypothetical protein
MSPSQNDSYGNFWHYLSQNQRDLILQGNYLMNDVIKEGKYSFTDYSFLVFPYAKAFEGYLKQLFYDIGFISRLDYISDHLRLGKLLSPNLMDKLGDKSLYKKLTHATTKEFTEAVWSTWRNGRNQVFHYFPHNIKAISLKDAEEITNNMLIIMGQMYAQLYEPYKKEQRDFSKEEKLLAIAERVRSAAE